jgi:hypothetical protein
VCRFCIYLFLEAIKHFPFFFFLFYLSICFSSFVIYFERDSADYPQTNSEKCLRKSPYSVSYSLCCGYKNAMISRPLLYYYVVISVVIVGISPVSILLDGSNGGGSRAEDVAPSLSHHITICIPERDCWASSSSSSIRAPSYFSSRV